MPSAPDPDADEAWEDDITDVTGDAARRLREVAGAARALRWVWVLAVALWGLTTAATFWAYWSRFGGDVDFGGGVVRADFPQWRLSEAIAGSLQGSWGYLLVAVVAYVGGALLTSRHLDLLLDAIDEADDDELAGGPPAD